MITMAILALLRDSFVLNGVTIPRCLSKAITVWVTAEMHTITSCSGPKNRHKNSPSGHPTNNSAIRSGVRMIATRRSATAMFIMNKLHGVHMLFFAATVTITMTLPIKPANITNAIKLIMTRMKFLALWLVGGSWVSFGVGGNKDAFAVGGNL